MKKVLIERSNNGIIEYVASKMIKQPRFTTFGQLVGNNKKEWQYWTKNPLEAYDFKTIENAKDCWNYYNFVIFDKNAEIKINKFINF